MEGRKVGSLGADGQNAEFGAVINAHMENESSDICRVEMVNRHFMGFGPACIFADVAISCLCDIRVFKGGRSVNAKSIMELLALCACPGDYLTIEAEGPGSDEAIKKLSALITNSYGIR